MINVTKLYCGGKFGGDELRYYKKGGMSAPVVVWNCTSRCNLKCRHCYIDARKRPLPDELSTGEAEDMIHDLAEYGVPVLLFSGGEPLLRPDILELGALAREMGIRTVISTNGTLIGKDETHALRDSGFEYVGISLDGLKGVNDRFRGVPGSFKNARGALRHCLKAGLKTGVRMTLNKQNHKWLREVMNFAKVEGIKRFCLYHLVYCGRGSNMEKDDLGRDETRQLMDTLIELAREFYHSDPSFEILTVDNHADGVYIYNRMLREGSERANEVLALLGNAGGNRSGIAIACVDSQGFVFADQFMRQLPLGNVRERRLSQIWESADNKLLSALRDRGRLLKGRCGRCRWQEICNGNMRARALVVYNDLWAEDPACYLTEEEITNRKNSGVRSQDSGDRG